MKVAIIGYGKMGHEIEQVLLQRGHSVALIIDQNNVHDLNAENLAGVDVAIEFTTPDTAYNNVRTCIECGIPVVSGTTGWHDRLEELQTLCREKNSTMIWSSNYSLGVNITFRLNRYLAELMNRFDAYNVAIEEIHHTQKKDAPSGTAISLANDILARVERKDEWVNEPTTDENAIEITSLREGTITVCLPKYLRFSSLTTARRLRTESIFSRCDIISLPCKSDVLIHILAHKSYFYNSIFII